MHTLEDKHFILIVPVHTPPILTLPSLTRLNKSL